MLKIKKEDKKIANLIEREIQRQNLTLNLIASENAPPKVIFEAEGSVLIAKAAEGYPGRRYHAGCENVDEIEKIAIERAKRLFQAEHANVQPHSGVNANLAVYFAVLNIGDTVLSMKLDHGGHLSHGSATNFSGQCYNFVHYGVKKDTERIDYDQLRNLAQKHRPKMIIAGTSAYSRIIDYPFFKEVADEVEAYLLVDMSHIAGLVAAGVHPSPIPLADFVTGTTYKTLGGGRGGFILCKKRHAQKIDKAVFPGTQGTPSLQMIAAKAVCFKRAMSKPFQQEQSQIVKNARVLAEELAKKGFRIVSGGTDNHQVIVDLRVKELTGDIAERELESVGIIANKNLVPFDPGKPEIPSGIRLGTPALTTRGFKEKEMIKIAQLINKILNNIGKEGIKDEVREEVKTLCLSVLLY